MGNQTSATTRRVIVTTSGNVGVTYGQQRGNVVMGSKPNGVTGRKNKNNTKSPPAANVGHKCGEGQRTTDNRSIRINGAQRAVWW